MKTVKTIERYDSSGNLIERVTETTETIQVAPPSYVPYMPSTPLVPQPCEPFRITWGPNCATLTGGTLNC